MNKKRWKYRLNRIKGGKLLVALGNKASQLFNKSIEVLKLLCFDNGAIISAPTSIEYCTRIWWALNSPPLTSEQLPYHLVWTRDGTYMAMAIDSAGDHICAKKFYEWCMQVQDHSGCWLQCYWPDGRRAVDNLEIDEVGSPIFGLYYHYLLTNDEAFMLKTWPMTQRAASFLTSNIAQDGLMNPSYDLWEERWGRHIYSNAAASAGLISASRIAKIVGEHSSAERWANAADNIKEMIFKKFWFPRDGFFARSIDPLDKTVDVSTLGLFFPFSLSSATDPHMVKNVKKIESKLVRTGGIMRYAGDKYDGLPEHFPWKKSEGNPWTSTTLWLALYYLAAGKKSKALRLYNWVVNKTPENLLIPQQIDSKGRPRSAIPFGLAHALFILATLELRKSE
jgi:glucoamylase